MCPTAARRHARAHHGERVLVALPYALFVDARQGRARRVLVGTAVVCFSPVIFTHTGYILIDYIGLIALRTTNISIKQSILLRTYGMAFLLLFFSLSSHVSLKVNLGLFNSLRASFEARLVPNHRWCLTKRAYGALAPTSPRIHAVVSTTDHFYLFARPREGEKESVVPVYLERKLSHYEVYRHHII